jgi:hypothetical protein
VKAYLDSSVILRRFGERGAIRTWSQWELVMASELVQAEGFRSIDRLRIVSGLRDAQLAELTDSFRQITKSVHEIAINSAVRRRAAAPFSSVVTALDAIHIATALVWMEDEGESAVFVTHDVQQAVAARLAVLKSRPHLSS